MSGSGVKRAKCSCPQSRCLQGNCSCFNAGSLCSGSCECRECGNTEDNKAQVDTRYKEYLKRKSPSVDSFPRTTATVVPPDGLRVPPGFSGCKCLKTKCVTGNCVCFGNIYRCTSKCKCQDCANPNGLRGSDIPEEVVQTTPSSNIESGKIGDTDSRAEEPVQMEEQHTQSRDNRGSGQNKRARN